MSELEQTFVCYLCGQTKPTTEQAMPCSYTRHFGQPVCVTCCEGCNTEEPFPCPDYEARKRSEQKRRKSEMLPEQITQKWLKAMDEQARKARVMGMNPAVQEKFYAAKKVGQKWLISNGRAWWDGPVLVKEIHLYADKTVSTHYYVEGVQQFNRRRIVESGMIPVQGAQLPEMLPLSKVVVFDHARLQDGRPMRRVYDAPND